MYSSLLCYRA